MKNRTLMPILFALLISCTTTTKVVDVNDNADYVALKEKYVKMIEENLKSDAQISLDNYLVGAGDIIGSRFGYYSVYMQDFRNTFIAYRPIVAKHNEDVFARQQERANEKYNLAVRKISGTEDWVEYQNNYNLERIYSGFLGTINRDVIRLRMELLSKEIDAFQKDRNLVFNEEQKVWVDNNMNSLLNLGLVVGMGSLTQIQEFITIELNGLRRAGGW